MKDERTNMKDETMKTTTPSAIETHTGTYLQRWQVNEIAEEAGVPLNAVTVLLSTNEAVKFNLPTRRKPLYRRRVVLELLGLNQSL